jgi:anti-anti-sigma factor
MMLGGDEGPSQLVMRDSVHNGCHELALVGELDLATATELEARILQICAGGAQQVVLDLSELVFVDSAGLCAVISSRGICKDHGCSFSLMHAQEPVERLLELTGVAQRLPFRRSPEDGRTAGHCT